MAWSNSFERLERVDSSESEMPEGMEGGEEKRMEEKSQLPFRTVLLKNVMSVMSILTSSWEALISDKNIVSASVFFTRPYAMVDI